MKRTTAITSLFLAVVTTGLYTGCRTARVSVMPQDAVESLAARMAPAPLTVLPPPPTPVLMEITWANNDLMRDQLQRAPNMKGPWVNVTGATRSPVTLATTQQCEVFRLVRNR